MSPSANSTSYVAFLRGINVGGVIVKMDALKKALESLKYKNVRTLLASGNVLFETQKTAPAVLKKAIEEKLKKTFGRDIGVLVRSVTEIEKLVKSDPFKIVKVTPQTRFYVTFLFEKSQSKLKTPYTSPAGDFKILRVTPTEICSVIIHKKEGQTLDLMGFVEKKFSKNVTTRNWNTVLKVLKK